MRVLTVCNNGNVRSVTLARILKGRGHQVLTLGANDFASGAPEDKIIVMSLCNWAEVIFVQKDSEAALLSVVGISPTIHKKIDPRFDVGPDDWKVPMHPDLLVRMRNLVDSDSFWSIHSK